MLDQPTTLPSVRAMCAIIRLVVVLPLVPVTATTGICGAIVVGDEPSGAAATRSAAWPTASATSSPGTASRTAATARPISSARSRCRHG